MLRTSPAVLALALSLVGCATSGDDEILFDSCNILYQAGDYSKAADCYQILVDSGVHNGPLHHDLGNALLHLERFGEAIYNYRQAQVFLPRESELRSHLGKAREAAGVAEITRKRSAASQALFFYDTLSPGELWAIAAMLNVCFWVLLCIRLFRRGEILTWTAIVFGIALAIFGTAAAHKHLQLVTRPSGVVLSGTATARSARDASASEMFRLQEGVEVEVIARYGDWYEVEVPGGRRGWGAGSTLGLIEYGWIDDVRP